MIFIGLVKLLIFNKLIFKKMIEKFKAENNSDTKQNEDFAYQELQSAWDDQHRIMTEINQLFKSSSDRDEAKKIIFEKWVPLMDAAIKKTSELTDQWLKEMNKSQTEYK